MILRRKERKVKEAKAVYEIFTNEGMRTMSSGADSSWEELSKAINIRNSKKEYSNGTTAGYYTLPEGCTELQDLISVKNMNAQIGEIFRACYRYGEVEHSPQIRDIRKILYYANAELKRLGG